MTLGGRQLPAVLLLLGEVEKIRKLAINSPYSRIVPESWVKEAQGQRTPADLFKANRLGENYMASRWLQLAFLLILLVASPLFASGPTGTITGTITAPSGAVVPKARVIVRNEETNATRDAETNEDGDYTVALLPPGRYRVAVESAGFRRSVFHGVSVDVDQTVRLDFALRVGAITEEVNVTDTPPIVRSVLTIIA